MHNSKGNYSVSFTGIQLFNSIFLFMDCIRAALHYSLFKIILVCLVLGLSATTQFIFCLTEVVLVPPPFGITFFLMGGSIHIDIPASPDDRVVELMYQYVPTANIQQKVIMSAFLHRVLRLSQQNSIWNWFKHRMTTSCSFLTSSVESLQNVNAARHRFLCHGSESGHWWH